VREHLDEPVLHRVEGVRLAAEEPVRDTERDRAVPAEQLVERGPVAGREPFEQGRVRGGRGRLVDRDDGHGAGYTRWGGLGGRPDTAYCTLPTLRREKPARNSMPADVGPGFRHDDRVPVGLSRAE